jgi:AcrR family transcriptional regulator
MPEQQPTRRRGRPSQGAREAIVLATRQLLEEQGLARLTTREIARRAGVAEASIFYHFGDRTGVVAAGLEAGLDGLRGFVGGLSERVGVGEVVETLQELSISWERFFAQILPLVGSVQADAELRDRVQEHLRAHGYGAHRGVDIVAGYLEAEQELGRVRADLDVRAAAAMLLGASCLRALQRMTLGPRATARLPAPEKTVSELAHLIGAGPLARPRGRQGS